MNEFEHMEQAGGASVDDAVINDEWSVLSDDTPAPEIGFARLYEYRNDQSEIGDAQSGCRAAGSDQSVKPALCG